MNKKTNILECPFQKERNGNMHSFIDFRCSVHNSLIYVSMIYLICSKYREKGNCFRLITQHSYSVFFLGFFPFLGLYFLKHVNNGLKLKPFSVVTLN